MATQKKKKRGRPRKSKVKPKMGFRPKDTPIGKKFDWHNQGRSKKDKEDGEDPRPALSFSNVRDVSYALRQYDYDVNTHVAHLMRLLESSYEEPRFQLAILRELRRIITSSNDFFIRCLQLATPQALPGDTTTPVPILPENITSVLNTVMKESKDGRKIFETSNPAQDVDIHQLHEEGGSGSIHRGPDESTRGSGSWGICRRGRVVSSTSEDERDVPEVPEGSGP